MDGYFLLLINAALYAITFVVYMLKKRMIDFGAICLFTFMLSSIGSAWYYSFDKVPSFYPDITISALLYIYFLFLLFVVPFLYLKRSDILSVNLKKYADVLNILSSFFAIIAVPVFLNLVFNFMFKSFSGNALNAMYESDVDNATLIFLPGIKTCYSFMRRFYDLIAFLFCYNLLYKGNLKIKVGLGMSVLSFFMVTFQGGSRGGIIMNLISLGGLILLFYRLYDNDIKRYVRIMGASVIGILVLGLMAISVSRFTANDTRDSDRVIDQWIAQYLGEGMVRFSDDLYPINNSLGGDKNFSYYKSLIGYPAIEDNEKANLKYEAKLKVPTSVFYTFIGSYYLDFGFIGTIVFACCISFFMFKLCNRINLTHHLGFVSTLIIIKYFKMISTGFTSNVYAVTSVQKDEFLFWLFIAGICLFSAIKDRDSSITGGVIRAFKGKIGGSNLIYGVQSLRIYTMRRKVFIRLLCLLIIASLECFKPSFLPINMQLCKFVTYACAILLICNTFKGQYQGWYKLNKYFVLGIFFFQILSAFNAFLYEGQSLSVSLLATKQGLAYILFIPLVKSKLSISDMEKIALIFYSVLSLFLWSIG